MAEEVDKPRRFCSISQCNRGHIPKQKSPSNISMYQREKINQSHSVASHNDSNRRKQIIDAKSSWHVHPGIYAMGLRFSTAEVQKVLEELENIPLV